MQKSFSDNNYCAISSWAFNCNDIHSFVTMLFILFSDVASDEDDRDCYDDVIVGSKWTSLHLGFLITRKSFSNGLFCT